MKRIKTLSTFIAIIGLLFIAQEGNAQSIKSDTIRESRLSNLLEAIGNNEGFTVADDNALTQGRWSIFGGIGINALQAEGNNKVNNLWDRRRIKMQIGANMWINNYLGLKGQIGLGKISSYYLAGAIYGQSLNSFDYPDDIKEYIIEKDGLAWFRRKFMYLDLSVAAMTDVVRWFDKENRWSVQLYAGPMLAYSFENQGFDSNTALGAKLGTTIDYKVSKNMSIMADFQGSIINESFDGVVGGEGEKGYKAVEGIFAAAIGVSYYFHENASNTTVDIPVTYQDTYVPQPVRIKEVQAPAKNIIAPFAVRFLIDKSNIEKGQMPQIKKMAEYLKANKNAKISLTGYADKETAYPEYNMRLSKRRVESVKKYLINECGIEAERIITEAKGDTERVYDEDSRWNRVVVMRVIEE